MEQCSVSAESSLPSPHTLPPSTVAAAGAAVADIAFFVRPDK
jgi:hypothetical protein